MIRSGVLIDKMIGSYLLVADHPSQARDNKLLLFQGMKTPLY